MGDYKRTLPKNEKARPPRTPSPSNIKPCHTGFLECLGLVSLALAMLYEASITNSFLWRSLVTIPEDLQDYLMGAALVICAIVGRFTWNLQGHSASLSSLTRAASSGNKLSQLSDVWKSSTSNLVHAVGGKNKNKQQTCVFSASESFVALSLVEQLSLVDITRVFQHALNNTEKDSTSSSSPEALKQVLETMDRAAFRSRGQASSSSEALKQVLETMDRAASHSRGQDVSLASAGGGIDALLLCAALRIFAEWRVARQTRNSFNKGYEMGMNLGRRDLIQNIGKTETAIHQYLQHQQEQQAPFTSPTVQQLLEYEVSKNVHSSLPKLANDSAAMGLLWAKRQVDYQACIYANLMQGPGRNNMQAAVKAAYKQVFDPYHGWWIQQMFSQSFRSAPPASEIYKLTNKDSNVEIETKSTATQETVPYWAESSCSSFDDSNVSDVSFTQSSNNSNDNDYQDIFQDDPQEQPPVECKLFGLDFWDKTTKHIQSEWDKVVEGTVALFQGKQCPPRLTTSAVQQHESRSNLVLSHRPSALSNMTQDDLQQQVAHQHFSIFLKTCQPMIQDISFLLHANNMNDPTKV